MRWPPLNLSSPRRGPLALVRWGPPAGATGLGLLRRGERLGLALQHEVVRHLEIGRRHRLAVRRLAGRLLDELDDQRRLDAVDHVAVDELVALAEEMGDETVVARRADREMD